MYPSIQKKKKKHRKRDMAQVHEDILQALLCLQGGEEILTDTADRDNTMPWL